MASPRGFQTYVYVLAALSAVISIKAAVVSGVHLPYSSLTAFFFSYLVVDLLQFTLPAGGGFSLGSALGLAATMWYGTGPTLAVRVAVVVLVGLARRTSLERLVFNVAEFSLSITAASFAYRFLGGVVGHPFLHHGAPVLAAIIALCVVQVSLGTVAISLYKGRSIGISLRDLWGFQLGLIVLTASCSIPLLGALQWQGEVWAFTLTTTLSIAASPVLRAIAKRALDHVFADLLSPLGKSLSTPTPQRALVHVVHVLARAAGLGARETDSLLWAALSHDLNEGDNSHDFMQRSVASPRAPVHAHEHALRTATRVGQLGSLLLVARYLETHHEQYNGWGHPFGLKGDEIPLPAAILGLAEAYLALVAEGPDPAKGETPERAVEQLKTLAGEWFHPLAVAALERAFRSGALTEEPVIAGPTLQAMGRLRQTVGMQKWPVEARSSGAGSDLWLHGTGGPRRFVGRLLSWDPLKVPCVEGHQQSPDWCHALYELGKTFGSLLDATSIASNLARGIRHLTSLPSEVCLVRRDRGEITLAAAFGAPPGTLDLVGRWVGSNLLGVAFTEERPVLSLDLTEDPRCGNREKARQLGIRSCVIVPLMAAGVPLGSVHIYSPFVRRFSPIEVEALTAVGNLAALALQNAFLYQEARERLQQLTCTQQFLGTILRTVPVGVAALEHGVVTHSNPVIERYFADIGLGPGDSEEGIMGELREKLGSAVVDLAVEDGLSHGPETVRVRLPGGERYYEVWASPLAGPSGANAGALLVLYDVTAARALEAETRRNERRAAVGEMAAQAAHEIRNPLSSILGFAKMLDLYCPARSEWKDCAAYVERIRTEIQRLEGIVQSMLVLARSGTPNRVCADLRELVRETIDFLSGEALEKGVTLKGPAGRTKVTSVFDPRQVKQVLLNLIQNAIDAVTGPGGPGPGRGQVTVTVGHTHREGCPYARVRVRDNGPGISDDLQGQLFLPFFTTKETGTGLGLAVCKGIVEAHGGFIEVSNARGGGALVEVLLPML